MLIPAKTSQPSPHHSTVSLLMESFQEKRSAAAVAGFKKKTLSPTTTTTPSPARGGGSGGGGGEEGGEGGGSSCQSPRAGRSGTYVPVVSLEYSLPGPPLATPHRLPPPNPLLPHHSVSSPSSSSSSPQALAAPSRLRVPCQHLHPHPHHHSQPSNLRVVPPGGAVGRTHVRNTLAVSPVDGPDTEQQVQGRGLHRHDVLRPLDFGRVRVYISLHTVMWQMADVETVFVIVRAPATKGQDVLESVGLQVNMY
ncbi:uncharacterized protein LOC143280230 [Babylonia areolata]|uniref:uncharacterized protein LOC143280230 n=1 Tax=Babylonia areolata TaxID=304850 RepID=UPI003FD2EF1B